VNVNSDIPAWNQDPSLLLINFQLQCQRCRRLERFYKVKENNFVFKMH
jgi:hypothetical protein